jgi:hypothetical protein
MAGGRRRRREWLLLAEEEEEEKEDPRGNNLKSSAGVTCVPVEKELQSLKKIALFISVIPTSTRWQLLALIAHLKKMLIEKISLRAPNQCVRQCWPPSRRMQPAETL